MAGRSAEKKRFKFKSQLNIKLGVSVFFNASTRKYGMKKKWNESFSKIFALLLITAVSVQTTKGRINGLSNRPFSVFACPMQVV